MVCCRDGKKYEISMATFKKVKIRDHCEITSSKRIFADEYVSSGVPFYRGKEISEKQKSSAEVSELIYISRKKYDEIKSKYDVPQKGDLLLTSVGTIGNPYLVKENKEFYFKDGNLTWFRAFHGINGQWLYYWLLSPQGKLELNKCTIGSSQKAYTINLLYGLEIELPDLKTQSRIASVLSAYDDLIENNEKRIKILEEMAQRLYAEWFVKFKFPGYEKAKMVDSGTVYGLIPEGWGVKELGGIANEKREAVDPAKTDPKTPYVGLEHLPRKSITLSNWGNAGDVNSGKLVFQVGDVLFGKIRPYFHKVVFAPIDGIASSDTIVITSVEEKYRALILLCVSSDTFVSYSSMTSQGSKMPRADWKTLVKYPIVISTDEVLLQFNTVVMTWVKEMCALMMINHKLHRICDLLIPQLVAGEKELR